MRLSIAEMARRLPQITRPVRPGIAARIDARAAAASRAGSGAMQPLIAIPYAGELTPLLDHHRGDAAIGRIGHRHLAAAVAHLEEQLLVVGHAPVQLALLGRERARTPAPMGWAARGSPDRAGDRGDSGSPAGRVEATGM